MAQGSSPNLIARAVIGLTASLWLLCASGASAAPPPKVGAPAPAFSLPLAANGQGAVTLASLKGHGVYLNFFATWCGPCKVEAPYIGKLSREFAKKNVVVIGVDELEGPDRAKGFAAQYGLPYKIGVDSDGEMGGSFGIIGLPLHVFIAPDGTVTMHREGEMSELQIRAALHNLHAAR